MSVKTTLSISEARKNFFTITDEVQSPEVYYTLTQRGRPKAVIVSADQFEALVNQQYIQTAHFTANKASKESGFVLRETPKYSYGDIFSQENAMLTLKKAPNVLHIERKASRDVHQMKEWAKAQLYIELIEKYHYPLYLIEVGRCVKIGGEHSRRYTEADIIISGYPTDILMLFSVSAMTVYDERKEASLKELFELAEVLSFGTRLKTHLVYYSRLREHAVVKYRCMVISYNDYSSYDAWMQAGSPSSSKIPVYQKD